MLSGYCAVSVPGPHSIVFTRCFTYCKKPSIGLTMYPLILRDDNGDRTVLFLEPGDVYILTFLLFFIMLLLFIMYRHLGLL